ncbi:hypothetical protein EX011_21320 [Salmonella enterica]|nr:hypothetical protein [Salmonella enterica]EBL7042066.1 hypothetical protein [Salmonella enterica]
MPRVIRLTSTHAPHTFNGYLFEPIEGTEQMLSEDMPQEMYDIFMAIPNSYVPYDPPKAEPKAAPAAKPAAAKKKPTAKATKE